MSGYNVVVREECTINIIYEIISFVIFKLINIIYSEDLSKKYYLINLEKYRRYSYFFCSNSVVLYSSTSFN